MEPCGNCGGWEYVGKEGINLTMKSTQWTEGFSNFQKGGGGYDLLWMSSRGGSKFEITSSQSPSSSGTLAIRNDLVPCHCWYLGRTILRGKYIARARKNRRKWKPTETQRRLEGNLRGWQFGILIPYRCPHRQVLKISQLSRTHIPSSPSTRMVTLK